MTDDIKKIHFLRTKNLSDIKNEDILVDGQKYKEMFIVYKY